MFGFYDCRKENKKLYAFLEQILKTNERITTLNGELISFNRKLIEHIEQLEKEDK